MQRAMTMRPDLGVVVVTAYDNDQNVLNCLKKGTLDYISKPIEINRFLETIASAVHNIRSRNDASCENEMEIDTPLVGWMEITAPNDMEYIERFNRFLTRLHSLPFSEREREELRQAIHQVGKLAVKRRKSTEPHSRLRMSYAVFSEELVIMIEDENLNAAAAQHLPEFEVSPLSQDQFADLKRLMDDVLFSQTGHILLLAKRF